MASSSSNTTFIPTPGLDGILARSELMHREMEEVGTTIATVAKELVPKDTHATEESIEGGAVLEGSGWTARASAGTEYAPYVEFETEDTPAQPFMRPALDAAIHGGQSGSVSR